MERNDNSFDYERMDSLLRDLGCDPNRIERNTLSSMNRTAPSADNPGTASTNRTNPVSRTPQEPDGQAQSDSVPASRRIQSEKKGRSMAERDCGPAVRKPDAATEETGAADVPDRHKKHHVLRGILLFLLIFVLILAAFAAILLLTDLAQPVSDSSDAARKTGCSTILLAGTDAGGTRTDTIVLCSLNTVSGSIGFLSIPRDTLVNDSYNVPKINGTYGAYGGGAGGMNALMDAVEKLVGFRPDGYALIDLDAFVELVDTMGGVTFDVPVDMYYDDPAQDLHIALSAGTQTLTGEEAMGVVRFRSGYALADLERVNVQRDFLSACIKQWLTPANLLRLPQILPIIRENLTTDLSDANFIWCLGALLRSDRSNIVSETLPGYAANWNGGSYYIVSAYEAVDCINASVNPYTADVTIYDLDIRTP